MQVQTYKKSFKIRTFGRKIRSIQYAEFPLYSEAGKYLPKNVIKVYALRFINKRELAYEVFYHRRITSFRADTQYHPSDSVYLQGDKEKWIQHIILPELNKLNRYDRQS